MSAVLALALLPLTHGAFAPFGAVPSHCGARHGTRTSARHSVPTLARHGIPIASAANQLQLDMARSRSIRRAGLVVGGALLAGATAVGVGAGMIDAAVVLVPSGAAASAALVFTLSHDEPRLPLADSLFEVRPSLIPEAGSGLFAVAPLAEGDFLFEYAGERLNEAEYFERYPTGQGRYVAAIDTLGEPVYIDGADPVRSGVARWMNSQTAPACNVRRRKQRYGRYAGRMFFYTSRDIARGEELTFDYGRDYWDAVKDEEDRPGVPA